MYLIYHTRLFFQALVQFLVSIISSFIASSGEDLIKKLKGNSSYIFTLIHKFNKTDVQPIIPSHELFVISDEAHRSQYGDLAENMCRLLPTAVRIGFTGTPLFTSDAITRRTFGDYISVYDFQRAVEDRATVPLYYENRADKIKNLHNPKITDELLEAIAKADLDDKQKEKLEQDFAKEYHLLTAQARLDIIAKDFVKHYSYLWETGKAMFVCLDKITCVRMYDLVQKYWQEEILQLEAVIKGMHDLQEAIHLQNKLDWMRKTEMAVVISEEQNEEERFAKWGLDIAPHRRKMLQRELDEEALQMQLEKMCLTNPARIDYYKRYNELIDAYNREQDRAEIEKLFSELMHLSRTMSEEAQRYVRENFDNDEQLAIYDLLFSDELSKKDIEEVKQMVKELYQKVTQMIAEYDHWKEKETTCAAIKSAISDTILDAAPDAIYAKQEIYQGLIYQYFYNNYHAAL